MNKYICTKCRESLGDREFRSMVGWVEEWNPTYARLLIVLQVIHITTDDYIPNSQTWPANPDS